MSGKREKEKRFEERLDTLIEKIRRIDVKPGEVLLIELDNRLDLKSFTAISKSFKGAFAEEKIKIIFGAAGAIKNITAVSGDAIKNMPDSDVHRLAAKEALEQEYKKEKDGKSFEDFREELKEGD